MDQNTRFFLNQLHFDLLNKIETLEKNDNQDQDDVIEFLKSIKSKFVEFSDNLEDTSLDYKNKDLEEDFKEVAKQSISSFSESNKNISNITSQHSEELSESNLINTDSFAKMFNSFQENLHAEINRANETISVLHKKVQVLEEASNTDPLTKLHNRRSMNNFLHTLTEVKHVNNNIFLIIIDIDHFKAINDEFGHIAGDKVLVFMSKVFRSAIRDGDKAYRYSGDEFVLVLNRIDFKNCLLVAKRILKTASSQDLLYQKNKIRVTLSIGVTPFKDGDTPEGIIARADKALYKAKNDGRNRIEVIE